MDKEIADYCKSIKRINIIDKLEAIIEHVLHTTKKVKTTTIHQVFNDNWNNIDNELKDKIVQNVYFYTSEDIDAEIVDINIDNIQSLDKFVIKRNINEYTLDCSAEVSIYGTLLLPSQTHSYYDKEDNERYIFDYEEKEYTKDFILEYTVIFSLLNGDMLDSVNVKINKPDAVDLEEQYYVK